QPAIPAPAATRRQNSRKRAGSVGRTSLELSIRFTVWYSVIVSPLAAGSLPAPISPPRAFLRCGREDFSAFLPRWAGLLSWSAPGSSPRGPVAEKHALPDGLPVSGN